MTEQDINIVCWWIPFKKTRNALRNVLKALNTNVSKIAKDINSVDNNISKFGKNVDDHIGKTNSDFHKLNTNFDKLDSSTSVLKQNHDNLKKEVANIVKQQNKLESWVHAKSKLQSFLLSSQGCPRLYSFGAPDYPNLGDQAIAIAERRLFNKLFTTHMVCEFTRDEYYSIIEELMMVIEPQDKIFTIGGGNFGNMYPSFENMRQSVIEHFPNNKIVSMGQSVTFLDNDTNDTLKKSQEIYGQHKNLHLVGRDPMSFERLKEYFPTNKHYLSPDTVLFLEEDYKNNAAKELDVLFLLRKDKEKVRSDEFLLPIENYIKEKNMRSEYSDTHIGPIKVGAINRKSIVEQLLKKISSAKVTVTDRYHGVIFSVITGTPCIALKSFDHKIPEGMKMLQHLDWAHYVEKAEDIEPLVKKYTDPNCKIEYKYLLKETILNVYSNMDEN